VTDELVVEVVEFETKDFALRGEMTITITLIRARWATAWPLARRKEAGWRSSLAKLAVLAEGGWSGPT
jgi:hypothetical protein